MNTQFRLRITALAGESKKKKKRKKNPLTRKKIKKLTVNSNSHSLMKILRTN